MAWDTTAKHTWRGLRPVRPEQFARVGEELHIVLDGAPYVLVIEGRDVDKLRNCMPRVPSVDARLPKPPKG